MQETRIRVLEGVEQGPVSGPALADQLDISRAAVWKHVEALREAGFEIPGSDDGYKLGSVPEFGPAVAFGLEAPFDVIYHDSIDSTNRRARELAAEGRSNVAVVADEQTGGRGRLDRTWVSPSGGVWLSALVRPGVPAAHAPLYTLAAAVATTRAVREAGIEAGIKWPNDVLVDGRKLAGILTEMEGEADRVTWLVVGVGLNADVDPAALPAADATSLSAEGVNVDRRVLTQRLLEEFHTLHESRETILPAWREYADTLGRSVRVETGDRTVEGEATDIEFPGTLRIDTGDGVEAVAAGDCEHLRPA
ncbi:MAG: birA, biotin-[acetyl-CoA-carboxylase] ligase region [halophilic archaeon J07HX64]|jgi:birA, biotin-[acetyl-CoA-carboxylase] ligase region|nr:MAG: birA, biotin-[acetyl-CoA-carboxylase] ligase region [halophilic archaeon J07HX64]